MLLLMNMFSFMSENVQNSTSGPGPVQRPGPGGRGDPSDIRRVKSRPAKASTSGTHGTVVHDRSNRERNLQ